MMKNNSSFPASPLNTKLANDFSYSSRLSSNTFDSLALCSRASMDNLLSSCNWTRLVCKQKAISISVLIEVSIYLVRTGTR